MLDKIEIKVDNFDMIAEGDFEVNKITVIKGGDSKNLSDLNRILFADLITLSCEGDYAGNNMFRRKYKEFLDDSNYLSFALMKRFNKFINDWDEYNVSYDYLSGQFKKFKKIIPKKLKNDLGDLEEYLSLFEDDSKKYREFIFDEMIKREFKTNKIDDYDDYEIKVIIDDVYDNSLKCEKMKRNLTVTCDMDTLPGNVIYLDKSPILNLGNIDRYYHYEELYSIITETHIECEYDTGEIEEMIKDLIKGEFGIFGDFYFIDNDDNEIDLYRLDNGTKHLGVLDLLLEGYGIPEKSILILNNIDKGMDDTFLKKTAEILVKLALELDLLLLINTKRDDFACALKDCYDDVVIYNAFKNDDNKYEFKLSE